MSSRKEYEMLFQLNAQMSGSYSSAFAKAQQQLTSMQKEIQALNKIQGDITSYQKQQQSIEATEKKLTILQQQYDNIQKEIAETGTYSSELENKLLSKQQQIEKTTEALDKQKRKLEESGHALQEAGVNTNNLTEESARLENQLTELRDQQREVAESSEQYGVSASEAFATVGSALAAAGIVTGLKEIAGAYVECIKVTSNFEESMSNVEALSGAQAWELDQLNRLAKEQGATTKFTAKESADALGYMAMAGWNAQQMIGGMPGVLQLAAASGEDLAQVSDIVTDSMTAFGLVSSQTSHYADVLAITATNANTNVSMMGETFKDAAPLAGTLGYSVEDVALATGLMANSGIKAGEAGTSLRNLFTRLIKPTKESADAMEALGISLTDDSGRMYTFLEIMEQMREGFSGLTEEQKGFYAAEMAGQRGISGLLAIVNAAEGDFAALSNAIANCDGAAQRMANIKLDNANGQLTLLNSAWEAVQTTVGEQFTPELQKLYSAGAQVLSQVNNYLQKHPEIIKAATAFIGIIGTATAGVLAYSAAVKVIQLLNLAAIFASPVGPILGVVAGVAALTAGVIAFVGAAYEGIPTVKELTEAARGMGEAMDEAHKCYEDVTTNVQATAEVMSAYIDRLEEIEVATDGNVAENEEYHNLLVLISRTMPELADSIDLTNNKIEGGTAALRHQNEAWKENAEAQAKQSYLNSLMDSYNDVMVEAAENSIKYTQAQIKLKKAEEEQAAVLVRMKKLRDDAKIDADEATVQTGTLVKAEWLLGEEYSKLTDRYQELNHEIWAEEETMKRLQTARDADREAIIQAEAEINDAKAAIEELTAATVVSGLAEDENAKSAEKLAAVIGTVQTRVSLLTEAYDEAYDAAIKSVGGQYEIWETADKVVVTSAGNINRALESQAKYWENYNANLQSLASRTTEIDGLSEIIASFADGSKDSVNAIAGMAKASDDDLRRMVENWRKVQEEQEAASGALADLKTDFTATMDDLQKELADDIAAMNLSDEAFSSGQATLQGYIDAASTMKPRIQQAYSELAKVATESMSTAYGGTTQLNLGTTPWDTADHHASGTTNASRGFAWVGENGPELVYFNGGEQVLNSQQTIAALQSAPVSAEISTGIRSGVGENGPVNITFQIEGNASIETVEKLEQFINSTEFEDRVKQVVGDAAEDAERMGY